MTDPSLTSRLCTACGLCCSGAMFDYGPLDPSEVDRARACGMDVLEAEDEAAFALPCPRLEGSTCQIYADRPETCKAFRCKTLRSALAGKIDEESALKRIANARSALGEVRCQLPEGATIRDARRWRREAGKASASKQLHASPMLMMALGLLDIELDLNFRKTGQRQVMPRED